MKNNLRVILADKKIKAAKIHEDTGISKTTITGIVNERTDPSLSTLIKLADYLDVKLDVLVAREAYTTEVQKPKIAHSAKWTNKYYLGEL